MKKATLKTKLLSLFIMLTMLIGMMPLSGIVSFAVGDDETCAHIDENNNAKCDTCDGFLSEPEGEIFEGELVTKDLPFKEDGFGYFAFTPVATDEYAIVAVESENDPLMYLYNSDGTYVDNNDDYIGRLFRVVATLSAGVTYYIALADYNELSSCTFKVYATCDEHVPVGETTCLGTVCAVCGETYGDPSDHTPAGPADCRGILCSVCDKYYGTPTDHTPTGPANCHGILCSVCNSYYGTPTDHVPAGPANCMGIYCSACRSYYGDGDPDYHMDYYKNDGLCDGCRIFAPNVQSTVTLKEIVTVDIPIYYEHIYATFTPEETRMYLFKSYETDKSYDPYLYIYDAEGNLLFEDDDSGEGYYFYLEAELEAGVTYYLRLRERKNDLTCTFAIKPLCDEHIPTETVNCLGTLCSYCEEYFGESNDEHTPSETVNCLGTLCSACGDYFGESGDHTLEGEMTCLGTMCSVCYDHFGETGDHKLEGEMTCLGTMCSVCYGYFGETGDHKLEGEMTCLGTMCSVCNDYFGEKGDHTPYENADCRGYLCDVCWEYYGEPAYDHADDDNDYHCDVCYTILTDLVVTVGENDVSLIKGKKVYYKFVPTESGSYRFESFSSFDPMLFVCDENGQELADADDIVGRNFYLEIELTGGEFYYLGIYEYNNDNICPIKITKLCDEHTPGEQTCLGYVCTVCGEYYGEAGDHTLSSYSYDEEYHYGHCDICDEYFETSHEYAADGKCECGYFLHEHIFDGYDYNRAEHILVCSICGIYDHESVGAHEYDGDGICECGRERLQGIYLGTQLLLDGQYLDNDGNVSTTAPEGGYAYYKDGVLTLNNFTLVNYEENPIEGSYAIYSETDLELVLVGINSLETKGEDIVYISNADLTISGDGLLVLYNEQEDGYTGDGIDVNSGKLTINGGNFIINATSDGIEVDGDTEINGGIFKIDSDDEGINLGSAVINGGAFYIHGEYVGIFANGSLTINGGLFEIYSYEESIYCSDILTINGGEFLLNSDFAAIEAFEGIVFSENMGEHNVEYTSYSSYFLVDDEGNIVNDTYLCPTDIEMGKVIVNDFVELGDLLVYNGEEQFPNIQVYNLLTGELLVEGRDYRIDLISGVAKNPGVYYALITGIGDYRGAIILDFTIHEVYDATLNETLEIEVPDFNDFVYTIVTFTPDVTATYTFVISADNTIKVNLLGPDFEYSFEEGYYWYDENGNLYFELVLEAGVTYYFDVYGDEEGTLCNLTVSVICPGHVGGEATYTEQAICEICGEHYGEIRECPGHFGGEATYQESPICEECGFHYGDKLYCDHMCHKGGIYAIIWGIFEEIYDYFGIETECECGEEH